MEAILARAGSLQEFLNNESIINEYYEAAKQYYDPGQADSKKFPRDRYDAVLKSTREIVGKVPELSDRLWETLNTGPSFLLDPAAPTFARRLDVQEWNEFVKKWRRKADTRLNTEQIKKNLDSLFAQIAQRENEIEQKVSGLSKKKRTAQEAEEFQSLRNSKEVRKAARLLQVLHFRDPNTKKHIIHSTNPDEILATMEANRKAVEPLIQELVGVNAPRSVRSAFKETLFEPKTLVAENPEVFPKKSYRTTNGTWVDAESARPKPIAFKAIPRRFHGIFKGVAVDECVGGGCAFPMDDLTPERTMTVAIDHAMLQYVEVEGKWNGFIHAVPVITPDGKAASLEVISSVMRRPVSVPDANGRYASRTIFDLWHEEALKQKPADWIGFAVGDSKGFNNMGSLIAVKNSPSHVFSEKKWEKKQMENSDPLIAKIVENSPKREKIRKYSSGQMIYEVVARETNEVTLLVPSTESTEAKILKALEMGSSENDLIKSYLKTLYIAAYDHNGEQNRTGELILTLRERGLLIPLRMRQWDLQEIPGWDNHTAGKITDFIPQLLDANFSAEELVAAGRFAAADRKDFAVAVTKEVENRRGKLSVAEQEKWDERTYELRQRLFMRDDRKKLPVKLHDLRSPMEELIRFETEGNGYMRKVRDKHALHHFNIPLKVLQADIAPYGDPRVAQTLLFEKDGETYVKWPVHQNDGAYWKKIRDWLKKNGHDSTLYRSIESGRTASASYAVSGYDGVDMTAKMSTNKIEESEMSKELRARHAVIARGICDYLQSHFDPKESSLLPIYEVAGFGLEALDKGITARDYSFMEREGLYLVPGFAFAHSEMSKELLERTGFSNVTEMFVETLAKPMGRVQAELLAKHGLLNYNPHSQNYLAVFKKDPKDPRRLIPTGRLALRDLQDLHVYSPYFEGLPNKTGARLNEFPKRFDKTALIQMGVTYEDSHGLPSGFEGEVYREFMGAFGEKFQAITGYDATAALKNRSYEGKMTGYKGKSLPQNWELKIPVEKRAELLGVRVLNKTLKEASWEELHRLRTKEVIDWPTWEKLLRAELRKVKSATQLEISLKFPEMDAERSAGVLRVLSRLARDLEKNPELVTPENVITLSKSLLALSEGKEVKEGAKETVSKYLKRRLPRLMLAIAEKDPGQGEGQMQSQFVEMAVENHSHPQSDLLFARGVRGAKNPTEMLSLLKTYTKGKKSSESRAPFNAIAEKEISLFLSFNPSVEEMVAYNNYVTPEGSAVIQKAAIDRGIIRSAQQFIDLAWGENSRQWISDNIDVFLQFYFTQGELKELNEAYDKKNGCVDLVDKFLASAKGDIAEELRIARMLKALGQEPVSRAVEQSLMSHFPHLLTLEPSVDHFLNLIDLCQSEKRRIVDHALGFIPIPEAKALRGISEGVQLLVAADMPADYVASSAKKLAEGGMGVSDLERLINLVISLEKSQATLESLLSLARVLLRRDPSTTRHFEILEKIKKFAGAADAHHFSKEFLMDFRTARPTYRERIRYAGYIGLGTQIMECFVILRKTAIKAN